MEIECRIDHGLNAPIAGRFRRGQIITVSEEIGSELVKDERWRAAGEETLFAPAVLVKTKKKEVK